MLSYLIDCYPLYLNPRIKIVFEIDSNFLLLFIAKRFKISLINFGVAKFRLPPYQKFNRILLSMYLTKRYQKRILGKIWKINIFEILSIYCNNIFKSRFFFKSLNLSSENVCLDLKTGKIFIFFDLFIKTINCI